MPWLNLLFVLLGMTAMCLFLFISLDDTFGVDVDRLFNGGHEPAYPWGGLSHHGVKIKPGDTVIYNSTGHGLTVGKRYVIDRIDSGDCIIFKGDTGAQRYRRLSEFILQPIEKIPPPEIPETVMHRGVLINV